MSASLLEQAVRRLGPDAVYAQLPPEVRARLKYEWEAIARPEQLLPELHPNTLKPWFTALLMAGRGYGKTRVGAEWVRKSVRKYPLVNLIGATADDARDIMIQGESGIEAICPPDEKPKYKKADRLLEWPNGAKSLIFTADEPDRLRGKQHMKVWADEIMSWRYEESWDQMILGLRLGDCPQVVATTTPRNRDLIKKLIKEPDCYVVRGSTFENAHNLAKQFLDKLQAKYKGTRLERQELFAEILDDVPGALWQRDKINAYRVTTHPELQRVAVSVDPSGGDGEDSDEQGIIVTARGIDGHGYVLADRSCSLGPDGWGRRAVTAYIEFNADVMVCEPNYGGQMVAHVVKTAARDMSVQINVKLVPSTRGKIVRAEPVAALHEQGREHHVGIFPELEDQLCAFTNNGIEAFSTGSGKKKKRSPDRADAMVFGMTELMLRDHVTLGDGPIASGLRRLDDPTQGLTFEGDNDMDDERGDRW